LSEDNGGSKKNNRRFLFSLDFWFFVAGIFASIAVCALTLWRGFDEADSAIMVFLTVVFTILMRIDVALIGKTAAIPASIDATQTNVTYIKRHTEQLVRLTATQPELLTDISSALERAKSIQNRADIQVDAVWGPFPPGNVLDDYYKTTLTEDIYTRRIISISKSNTVEVILDHIREHWAVLVSRNYKIFVTRPLAYEMLIVDNEEAAYFHFPGGGIAVIFIRSNENRFVNGVRSEWDKLLTDTTEFPATDFGKDFDEAAIKRWLQEMSDKYK
jgi:hypothetical protein